MAELYTIHLAGIPTHTRMYSSTYRQNPKVVCRMYILGIVDVIQLTNLTMRELWQGSTMYWRCQSEIIIRFVS